MNVDSLNVHYLIGGKLTVIKTKMFYERLAEEEMRNIHFEVQINDYHIKSKSSDSVEYAVKHLQKQLPDNIEIACCQACIHGNFNPFGDLENQIFCLQDKTPSNRKEVVDIFSKQDKDLATKSRNLLDFCNDFKPISPNKKFTYNDWV